MVGQGVPIFNGGGVALLPEDELRRRYLQVELVSQEAEGQQGGVQKETESSGQGNINANQNSPDQEVVIRDQARLLQQLGEANAKEEESRRQNNADHVQNQSASAGNLAKGGVPTVIKSWSAAPNLAITPPPSSPPAAENLVEGGVPTVILPSAAPSLEITSPPPSPPTATIKKETEIVKDNLIRQGVVESDAESINVRKINLNKVRLEEVGGATNLSADEVVEKKIDASRTGGVEIKLSDYQKRDAAKAVVAKAIKVKDRTTLDADKWNGMSDSEIHYQRFNKEDCAGIDLNRAFMTTFTKCNFDETCTLPADLSKLEKKYFLDCTFSKEFFKQLSSEDKTTITSQLGLKLEDGFYKTAAFKDLASPSGVVKPVSGFRVAAVNNAVVLAA